MNKAESIQETMGTQERTRCHNTELNLAHVLLVIKPKDKWVGTNWIIGKMDDGRVTIHHKNGRIQCQYLLFEADEYFVLEEVPC